MGMSHYTKLGYGLLVIDAEEVYDLPSGELNPPDGIIEEPVGDGVLGEDCGLFFMVEKSGVSVVLDSEVPFEVEYINEYVTEYTDYTLPAVSPEILSWFVKTQEELDKPCKLGVFMVEYIG